MFKFLLLTFFFLFAISVYAEQTTILYEQYEAAVSVSKEENKPLLLIFSADWCGYCNKLKTEILIDNSTLNYIVCVLDTEANKIESKKFKIKSLPTSIIIKENEEKDRKVGYKGQRDYISWLNNQ